VEFLSLNRALVQYYLDCGFAQLPPIYLKGLGFLLKQINESLTLDQSWMLVVKAVQEMDNQRLLDGITEIATMWQAVQAMHRANQSVS
jgi:hypothetical protein